MQAAGIGETDDVDLLLTVRGFEGLRDRRWRPEPGVLARIRVGPRTAVGILRTPEGTIPLDLPDPGYFSGDRSGATSSTTSRETSVAEDARRAGGRTARRVVHAAARPEGTVPRRDPPRRTGRRADRLARRGEKDRPAVRDRGPYREATHRPPRAGPRDRRAMGPPHRDPRPAMTQRRRAQAHEFIRGRMSTPAAHCPDLPVQRDGCAPASGRRDLEPPISLGPVGVEVRASMLRGGIVESARKPRHSTVCQKDGPRCDRSAVPPNRQRTCREMQPRPHPRCRDLHRGPCSGSGPPMRSRAFQRMVEACLGPVPRGIFRAAQTLSGPERDGRGPRDRRHRNWPPPVRRDHEKIFIHPHPEIPRSLYLEYPGRRPGERTRMPKKAKKAKKH